MAEKYGGVIGGHGYNSAAVPPASFAAQQTQLAFNNRFQGRISNLSQTAFRGY